jgi:hypothetical protein
MGHGLDMEQARWVVSGHLLLLVNVRLVFGMEDRVRGCEWMAEQNHPQHKPPLVQYMAGNWPGSAVTTASHGQLWTDHFRRQSGKPWHF